MLLCVLLVRLPLGVLFLALMSSGLGHTAFVGITVICLLLVGACSAFCSDCLGLACHNLPIAAGRFARADRVCLACNSGAVGDARHMVFECTARASMRFWYVSLFTGSTGNG